MGGPTAEEFDATLADLLTGDEDAFRRMYRSLNPALVRYLSALVGPGDAEDVASETWGQASRDLDRFQGGADGFRAWVTTIGRHRGLDLLRQRARRPQVVADLTVVDPPDPVDHDLRVEDVLGTRHALALLRELPQDQAEALMLRVVMGLDARSAGQVLGKRPGAVRSAAQRGLRNLARRVDSTEGRVWRRRDIFAPRGAEGVR